MWYIIQVPLALLIVTSEIVLKWATSLNSKIGSRRRKSLDQYIEAENLYVEKKYSEANKYKFASRHRRRRRLLIITSAVVFTLLLMFVFHHGLVQYELRGEALGWW